MASPGAAGAVKAGLKKPPSSPPFFPIAPVMLASRFGQRARGSTNTKHFSYLESEVRPTRAREHLLARATYLCSPTTR